MKRRMIKQAKRECLEEFFSGKSEARDTMTYLRVRVLRK